MIINVRTKNGVTTFKEKTIIDEYKDKKKFNPFLCHSFRTNYCGSSIRFSLLSDFSLQIDAKNMENGENVKRMWDDLKDYVVKRMEKCILRRLKRGCEIFDMISKTIKLDEAEEYIFKTDPNIRIMKRNSNIVLYYDTQLPPTFNQLYNKIRKEMMSNV